MIFCFRFLTRLLKHNRHKNVHKWYSNVHIPVECELKGMPVPAIANSISSSSSHKVGNILVNERHHTTNHLYVLLDHFGNQLGHLADTKVPFMSGKSEGKVRERVEGGKTNKIHKIIFCGLQ